nr:CCA tRNA nucleotidyltransferase 1, mitochondrial [Ciona intestinalis]|eukprot:XP_002122885.1 CCA tRNA nucleotidyltransferase 1, mitochondrial [Ciona intestinalis]
MESRRVLFFTASFVKRLISSNLFTLSAKRTVYPLVHRLGANLNTKVQIHEIPSKLERLHVGMGDVPQLSENATKPVIIKLQSPLFTNLFTDEFRFVQHLFEKENHELRFCGGAVRDLLLGKAPHDLDLATTATPTEMIEMFRKNDVRLICENGWSHGTVTCRVEEQNFEITTLRIDRVTDGRRALVEYTKDWYLDASRRDLTCNSLFLTMSGNVIDYFNGISDVKDKKVRFVGDPALRIQEDYLRILRYFRFFGRLKEEPAIPDESTLQEITKYGSGLGGVAGERKWVEFTMILNGRLLVLIMKMMYRCGILKQLGLPEQVDLEEFENVYNRSKHFSPNHMTLLTSILKDKTDLDHFMSVIKCSRYEYNVAKFIIEHRALYRPDKDMISVYVDLLVDSYKQDKNLVNVFMELMKYIGQADIMDYFTHFNIPTFPLKGGILKERFGMKGKPVGIAINFAFQKWKESRYKLDSEALLQLIENNRSDFVKK